MFNWLAFLNKKEFLHCKFTPCRTTFQADVHGDTLIMVNSESSIIVKKKKMYTK